MNDRACIASRDLTRILGALLLLFAASWAASAENAKPVSPPGRPNGEHRSAEREGSPVSAILLVARADLPDSNFRDSVVLVMNNIGPAPGGLIVNRPTRMAVSRLFPEVERLGGLDDKVYFGGPVQVTTVSFLFRADTPPEHAVRVVDGVYVSTDAELLRTLIERDKPMDGLRIFVGYSGWGAGQLEAEIARGDWTLAPATAETIFERKSEHPWPEKQEPDPAHRS